MRQRPRKGIDYEIEKRTLIQIMAHMKKRKGGR